jgi:hypothetical protein
LRVCGVPNGPRCSTLASASLIACRYFKGNPYNRYLSPRRSPPRLCLANPPEPVKREIVFGKSFFEKKSFPNRGFMDLKCCCSKRRFQISSVFYFCANNVTYFF